MTRTYMQCQKFLQDAPDDGQIGRKHVVKQTQCFNIYCCIVTVYIYIYDFIYATGCLDTEVYVEISQSHTTDGCIVPIVML
jgi:hypothetical protein